MNIATDKDIPAENPGSEAVQKEYKMTEIKETEETGTQTIKVIRKLQRTKSHIAKELEMSPEQKINVAIEDEYLKTMDFMDNYVEQSDLMKSSIERKQMVTTDNEDFYEMVNRDISPDDLGDIGKAFRDQKIKIFVKSDEDVLSEGNG